MAGAWRVLLIVAGAVAAVVLLLVLRERDGSSATPLPPPPPPRPGTIRQLPQPPPPADRPQVVRVDARSGSLTRATVARGKQVVLLVTGPAGEEVHLHGYDVRRNIAAHGTVRLAFRATIPGRFEVELEESHRQIADLTVR